MKRRIIFPILLVLMMAAACQPASTLTPEAQASPISPTKTATQSPTDTPATATPAPTETPDFTFYNMKDYMVIQQGNDGTALILQTLPSQELADNHVGVWWGQYGEYQDSEFLYNNGFTHLRIGSIMDWSGDDQEWPLKEDTLLPRVDDKITEYAENGIKIALFIQEGTDVPYIVNEFSQEDIDKLLGVTAFIVEHFKGRITYYEIFNEFGNTPKVHTYANLVEQSAALIKEIDPNAKVIFGSIPGDQIPGVEGYGEHYQNVMNEDYMYALINAVDFGQIDGFTLHPFYDNIPVDDRIQNYPQMVAEMKARLAAKGFSGEYFADEILWHTWDELDYPNGPPVSKIIAAKYYLRTITEHRGLDFIVTINTFFQVPEMDAIRNLNNILAGAEPLDSFGFLLEMEEEVQYMRQYAFTLPDGDILLAVWRNGSAEEQDAGVAATLTIPAVSGDTVTGIDPFYGFEQQMLTESLDGDLIIENLIVKDYPLFIRIDHPNR